MALQKSEKNKRPRQDSSDEFCVEEVSLDDDIGYEGDIEVLRPDYEEPDSDFEDDKATSRLWPSTDDDLAGRLRRLSCDPQLLSPKRWSSAELGRKRMSREMEPDNSEPQVAHTEIEVSEFVDGHPGQPPTKRRKKKPSQQEVATRAVKHAGAAWWDSTDSDDAEAAMDSSNSATPGVTRGATPTAPTQGSDAMDVDLDM